jgi:hypothetical protein
MAEAGPAVKKIKQNTARSPPLPIIRTTFVSTGTRYAQATGGYVENAGMNRAHKSRRLMATLVAMPGEQPLLVAP